MELPSAEQSRFENHFFECPDCARDVRLELSFAANIRAVLREWRAQSTPPAARKPWLVWVHPKRSLTFSLAGNAFLVIAFTFLLMEARQAVAPRLLPVYFAPGPARGADDSPLPSISRRTPAFVARIPVPIPFTSYSYQILNAEGRRESSGAVSPSQLQQSELCLEVPITTLRAGVHILEVRGNPGSRIVSQFKFRKAG
jgi:hypothetical protein